MRTQNRAILFASTFAAAAIFPVMAAPGGGALLANRSAAPLPIDPMATPTPTHGDPAAAPARSGGDPAGRDAPAAPAPNGIIVSVPKIYDDRTLQLMLADLSNRLAQISGTDQASLISRIGSLQGSNSSQTSFGVQISGPSVPGSTTKVTSGTPGIQTTTGGQYPGTTTTIPSTSTETNTTVPAFTGTPAALPAYGSQAAPSTFQVSSIDALNEQMQLNYELMNLRLLLNGALNDQYTDENFGRTHVTLGFPIGIETPKKYRDAIAEVQVTICGSTGSPSVDRPILQTLLPKEKTYNSASLVSKSAQLGIGAVIANVISFGGSFMHGRQTYYVVREQDTIAIERPVVNQPSICGDPQGAFPPSKPLSFAWQFRPVLGRSTIQQGMRQTFAQIAFPPNLGQVMRVSMAVDTCWRKYDRKAGIAGDYIKGSCNRSEFPRLRADFDTSAVNFIEAADNSDGSVTTTLHGAYLAGTQIAFGDAVAGEGSIGFRNTGKTLRFTAPLQLIGTRGARIVSPDGREGEIKAPERFLERSDDLNDAFLSGAFAPGMILDVSGKRYAMEAVPNRIKIAGLPGDVPLADAVVRRGQGIACGLPGGTAARASDAHVAQVAPYSDNQVKMTVPVIVCPEFGPQTGGPYPWIAVMGGKTYGLSDAPFLESGPDQFVFLAPKLTLQGETSLLLKRLFGGRLYDVRYTLNFTSGSTSGISIFSTTKTTVTFALRGAGLLHANILRPANVTLDRIDDTLLFFTMSRTDIEDTKAVLLKIGGGAPTMVTLPAVKEVQADKKPSLKDGAAISRSVPQPIMIEGSNLGTVVGVQYLDKHLPFTRADDGTSIKITQVPTEMLLADGAVPVEVQFADKTTQTYAIKVGP